MDYGPSAGVGNSMMPQQFLDDPVEQDGEVDLTTSRRYQLGNAHRDIFTDECSTSLLTKLALWFGKNWDQRSDHKSPEIREDVCRSVLAIDPPSETELEEVRHGPVAERWIAHIEKLSRKDKDMVAILHRIQCQGFRQLAGAKKGGGPIEQDVFRRHMLCLMVDSFWHVSRLWCIVMESVRQSLADRFEGLEGEVFDRLYLPQPHLADLPMHVLWPRLDITRPLTLQNLWVPADETWRFGSIPYCLGMYVDMDDATRAADRKRKRDDKGKRKPGQDLDEYGHRTVANPDNRPIQERVDPSSVRDLDELLDTLTGRPCPKCQRIIADAEWTDHVDGDTGVRVLPCGCVYGLR